MSLKDLARRLKSESVALFPPKERKHATPDTQHATCNTTHGATAATDDQQLQGEGCNIPRNKPATHTKKQCNKRSLKTAQFVAYKNSTEAPAPLIWHLYVDDKGVTAIDFERLSHEQYSAFLDRKFGRGRVHSLKLMNREV